ncbi:unnamed protein product [Ilex paraguariensis]|uniref:Uncharacterized protein n=1 Tax=Ilex paraguariensis TaxID=185542 RepID=A0ABC8R3Z7_9AQUA
MTLLEHQEILTSAYSITIQDVPLLRSHIDSKITELSQVELWMMDGFESTNNIKADSDTIPFTSTMSLKVYGELFHLVNFKAKAKW